MQKEKVLISIHPEDSFSPEEEVIIATEKVVKFLTDNGVKYFYCKTKKEHYFKINSLPESLYPQLIIIADSITAEGVVAINILYTTFTGQVVKVISSYGDHDKY